MNEPNEREKELVQQIWSKVEYEPYTNKAAEYLADYRAEVLQEAAERAVKCEYPNGLDIPLANKLRRTVKGVSHE
jgi:hypothetical protein